MTTEEQKKPKIDLKSRIPSKTVKGLVPSGSGAIPPPPGVVPAPPADLLGKPSQAPRAMADASDPLGAARMEGGAVVQAQPQIVLVHGHEHDGVAHPSKKNVVYAIVGVGLVVGLGVGFLVGAGSGKRDVATKAKSDAKELQDKVSKATDNLEKFRDTLKGAQSELANKGYFEPGTISAVKGFSSGLTAADLQTREIAYFGAETAGKLIGFAYKVNHIDELRARLTKGDNLENITAQLKAIVIPPKKSRWGVQLMKPESGAPQITTAALVDFGEPLDLKDKVSTVGKEPKLLAKAAQLDVWPGGKTDFFDKSYTSAIDGKEWMKACPLYTQAQASARQSVDELIVAIEGVGDDPGALKPGKALADKLKSLTK